MADRTAFLQLARDRFRQAEESDRRQRERELEDLRFHALEQWPEEIKRLRQGQSAVGGMPPVPARPCLVLDKTGEAVRQVLNQERQSDLSIELVPADDFGDTMGPEVEAEIELREGLVRRIQRASEAASAFSWAFSRAVIAGRGYFCVMTRYLPGKTQDQEIYIRNIYNQASVTLDPAHEQPDGSDADWGFIGIDMPEAQYAAEGYTLNNRAVSTITEDEFRNLGEEAPGWFTTKDKIRFYRVVEYWYVKRVRRTVVHLPDGTAAWQDELKNAPPDATTHEVIEKQIKWAKIDGVQVLDETDWPGPDLPIVKVLGEELHPYDAERRVRGMIRPMRDACQGENAMASKLVEVIGLTPVPPLVLDPQSIEGYEEWYKQATTRTLPYLPQRTRDDNNQEFREAHRPAVEPPIQAIAAALQMFNDARQSASGVHDPSLGKVDPTLKSGRALLALQQQSAHGTSNFLDNLQRSLRYTGQIVNNLLYPIYGTRPGRLARIVTGTGEVKTITVNAPQQMANGNGAVQSVNKPQKQYRLTKDVSFNIIVKVSPSTTSSRDQAEGILTQLLSAEPQLMTVFGDLFFKYQDWQGHQEMAERAKIMLDPKIQTLLEQEKQGQDIPAPIMAKIAAQGAQIHAAEQAMAELKQALDTKQVENQAKQQIAALQSQEAIALQRMKDATSIEVAKITATKDAAQADADLQLKSAALAMELQAKKDMHAEELKHKMAVAQMDQETKRQALQQSGRKKVVTSKILRSPDGDIIGKQDETTDEELPPPDTPAPADQPAPDQPASAA